MRPTNVEILDAIAAQLESQVLPAVDDKWAASTLRSSLQLLRHLALRVAVEPSIAADDSADVRAVLKQLRELLSAPELCDLKALVAAAQANPDAAPYDIAARDANDEAAQAAVEAIVTARSRVHAAIGSLAVHDLVVAYLQRRMRRERELFLPVCLTSPI